jgi:hypothetical protein
MSGPVPIGRRIRSVDPVVLLALACALLACSPSAAADPLHVYDGMTPRQLADFAERQGWRANVSTTGASLAIHADGNRINITMLGCGEDGSCGSGIIRDTTYYFLEAPHGACHFWHWNLETKGATGFGPNYVTLQRYVQFRGVTDQYLKDAIDAWLAAAPSFWKLVKECAAHKGDDELKGPKP